MCIYAICVCSYTYILFIYIHTTTELHLHALLDSDSSSLLGFCDSLHHSGLSAHRNQKPSSIFLSFPSMKIMAIKLVSGSVPEERITNSGAMTPL